MNKKVRKSRTERVVINAGVNTFCQLLTFLLNFINRTIFIQILGVEYLGVNGLFTNILSILSLAELGIGGAITFHLYKPLSEENEKELQKLIKIYATIYKFIGLSVIILGILIIPFLNNIIGEVPDINENIYIIYMIFLLDSAISYFNVYKSTIITADQKDYINVMIRQLTTIIAMIIRLIILFITKNYLLYLGMQIIGTIVINLIITYKANQMYPFIRNAKKTQIDKIKLKRILNDAKSIVLYKFGGTILDGTDNIIISILLGVSMVGYASNYVMIITAITTMFNQIINAFTASIGNLNIEREADYTKEVFYRFFFICFWLYSFGSVMLIALTNDLIRVWLGAEYVLAISVIVGLVFSFYIKGVQTACWMYRSTLGLFRYGKYSPLAAAILNIFLSVILCNFIGLGGIFIATGISRMFTIGIVDPILLYRKKFKGNSIEYFRRLIYYFFIFILLGTIIYIIGRKILVENFIELIIKAILLAFIFNIIFIIIFRNNNEYKEFFKIIKEFVIKFIRKVKKQ